MIVKTDLNNEYYCVCYNKGSYEDRISGILCVCETEDFANEIFTKLEEQKNHRQEIAIKDLSGFDFVDVDDIDNYELDPEKDLYSFLYDKFHQQYFEKIGKTYIDELSDEEYEKFNDYDNNENFKSFLISEGYSEEVADATIEYNNYDEWSDIYTDYYVQKILFVKKGEKYTFEKK